MKRHVLTHTGEKKFKCDTCGAAFARKCQLTQHFPIHTREKNYKCQVCGISFLYNSSLNSHILLHTGEKKYKCGVCSVSFLRSCELKKHLQKIHSLNESTRNNRLSGGNLETQSQNNSSGNQTDVQCNYSDLVGTRDLLLKVGEAIATGIDLDDKIVESCVGDVKMENPVVADYESSETRCELAFAVGAAKVNGTLEDISDKG